MRAKIHISLKPGVLDPQGKAVGDALRRLGFGDVSDVRVGKIIEIDLPDSLSPEQAERQARDMCERLLANTVVERYAIELA